MTEQMMKTATCTFCQFNQVVMRGFEGDKMYCQRCGNQFEIGQRLPDSPFPRMAKLALSYNFIDGDQLKQAMAVRKKEEMAGRPTSIEEIFARLNMISPRQMKVLHTVCKFLDLRKLDKEFSDLAIKAGYVSPDVVDHAQNLQASLFKEKKSVLLLGDILVRKEKITEKQRDEILRVQGRIEAAKPTDNADDQKQDGMVTLTVSEDSMEAILSVPQQSSGRISLGMIHKLLEDRGVEYGILNDETINGLLETGGSLAIAQGKPAVPGVDASVRYFFETDYLRAGTIDEDGKIDFKDRGEIPFVTQGSVLAQKAAMQRAGDGIDIMGRLITAEEPMDVELNCGPGAEFGDDQFTVIANTDGQPCVSMTGSVMVVKEARIDGDVDYRTGHIDFQGNVRIGGTVKEGFRVKGVTVHAREVVGGEIDAEGNVLINGGLLDASIRAKGNVYVTFIKNSTIKTYGNIFVKQEILDSEILSSGFCKVENGTILSSSISAKKGIQAPNIGNEILKPSRLTIGVDRNMENELRLIDGKIDQKNKLIKELDIGAAEAKEQISVVHDMISEMAHEQDRAGRERKLIAQTLERFSKKKGQRKLDHAEARLIDIDKRIQTADETIRSLFEQEKMLNEKIAQAQTVNKAYRQEIQDLDRERNGIEQWAKNDKAVSVIRINGGAITGRTVIQGAHTQRILQDTYHNVHLKEVKLTDAGNNPFWDIQVIRN